MTSLGRAIASSLSSELHVKTRVASLKVASSKKAANQWQLLSETQEDLGTFDWVICTAPTAQAVDILPEEFAHFSTVQNTKIDACFTLMLGWEAAHAPAEILHAKWDMLSVNTPNSPLQKLVLDHRKHGATDVSLTVYSRNDWAEKHVDSEQLDVKASLVTAVNELLKIDSSGANHSDMHRWRYAKPHQTKTHACLVDPKNQLIAAGDWCLTGSVEGAFLSGQAAAHAIIAAVT